MNSYINRFSALLILFIVLCGISCKKYVEIPPPDDKLVSSAVFSNASDIASAMSGLYGYAMAGSFDVILNSDGTDAIFLSLAADDAITVANTMLPFYTNTFALNDYNLGSLWTGPYLAIGRANSFINSIEGSTVISDSLKADYIAQARLIRAYYYVFLTTLYDDVPLPLSADFTSNGLLPRSSRDSVLGAVLTDMLYARDHLTSEEGANAYTFNQNTANALLARVYGYQGNWAAEEEAASAVINSNRYSLVTDPANVFDRGSSEAIYQVSNAGSLYYDGIVFSSYLTGYYIQTLSPALVNSFEPDDLRFAQWVIPSGTSYKVNKYSPAPANPQELVPIRLADVILLRAEARAQLDNLDDAIDDINLIRERAQIPDLPHGLDKQTVLDAMMKERRTELFVENDTRWFDLERWGILESTMSAAKPTTWTAKAALFPVTVTELNLNPNLKQTVGY